MDKASIKEKLWIVGLLMIVFGMILSSFFMLSNEELYFFGQLNQYAVGFLILGLILLVFGFLFAITCLHQYEASENKAYNTTKRRVVLIVVALFFLILIGYLMSVDYEWTVKALIIEDFDQIFAFYPQFTLTSYSAMFATLLIFGIFVLPFVISETGFLDDQPASQLEDSEKEGQSIEEAEDQVDRLASFLKKRFGSIKKIRNYLLPIGIALTIVGGCLIGLPHFFLIDSPKILDPETGEWFRKDYKGFIRGQLLLIGILLLVIGLVLIRHYIRRNRHSTDKENSLLLPENVRAVGNFGFLRLFRIMLSSAWDIFMKTREHYNVG
jgi:hypothetical protein